MEKQDAQMFLDAHKVNVSEYKTLAAKLAAAEGSLEEAIQDWMETSEDELASRLRNAIEEAERRLRTLAEENVKPESLSDEEKENLVTSLTALKEKVRSGKRGIEKLNDAFGLDFTEELKEIGDPTLKSGPGAGTSGTGSSAPRATVICTVWNKDFPDAKAEFDTMGKTADYVGVDLKYLVELFAEAGGVKYEDVSQIKSATQFTVPQQAGSQATWVVATRPKETKPRGRAAVNQPASNTPKLNDSAELPAAVNTTVS